MNPKLSRLKVDEQPKITRQVELDELWYAIYFIVDSLTENDESLLYCKFPSGLSSALNLVGDVQMRIECVSSLLNTMSKRLRTD